MKVSLRRKIHIMAFIHDTFLKARWSDDQSANRPRKPAIRGIGGAADCSPGCAIPICSAICHTSRASH